MGCESSDIAKATQLELSALAALPASTAVSALFPQDADELSRLVELT